MKPTKPSGWWLRLAPLTLLAAGAFLLRRSGNGHSPSSLAAPSPDLQFENQQLRAQLTALQAELDQLRRQQSSTRSRLLAFLRANPWGAFFFALGAFLAALPPLLVVLDRWFAVDSISNYSRDAWCKVDFLCHSAFPAYFPWIFASALGLFVLSLLTVKAVPGLFRDGDRAAALPAPQIAGTRVRIAQGLMLASLGGVILSAVLAGLTHSLPGWGLLFSLLGYLLSRVLAEIPLRRPLEFIRARARVWLALALAFSALAVFLWSLAESGQLPLFFTLLFVLALVNLLRFRREVSLTAWLVMGSLVVFTLGINSWRYAGIGDEYSFYYMAREIATLRTLAQIGQGLFKGDLVYGSHPYFSSLIQAATIKLFGTGHFGWDFSNPLLSALSVGLFYGFFKRFLSARASLLSALLIGVSYYIINFSKIGYNNLQALFGLALVLYTAGYAVKSGRALGYTLLGASMGLCLYLYPAALYVLALGFLALLVYAPPTNRQAVGRWVLVAAAFFILFLPLLFQPGYFLSKLPGTFMNVQWDGETSFLGHLGYNTLYTLFSYLFIPQESHFVVSSYVDPLTALFVLPGLALLIRQVRRSRFALFTLLAFLAMFVLVGLTHDRAFPPNTRAFLLLPFFALFAGLALDWLVSRVEESLLSPAAAHRLLAAFMVIVLAANLFQAFAVTRQRMAGTPSLEALFLRMLQTERAQGPLPARTYLFVTDQNWGVDGLRLWPDLYALPASQAELVRYVSIDGALPPDALARIKDPDTIVILQPWMDDASRSSIQMQLTTFGKQGCIVRDTRQTDPRFTFWYSSRWRSLCELTLAWQ